MSIRASDIRQGGFYVNDKKGLIREVWLISEAGQTHWRSFYLESGKPANDSCACYPERIAKWANRVATSDEIARLDIQLADHLDRAATQSLLNAVRAIFSSGTQE